MHKFTEADLCRAELARIAERRRRALEELEAVNEELTIWTRRARAPAASLTVSEIADRLGMSRESVYRYLRPDD